MKKLSILIVLIMSILVSCEKESIDIVKFEGIWISNALHLPDFESSKMILKVEDQVRNVEILLTPISLTVKIDSIFHKIGSDSFTVYFNFMDMNQYGNIEIFKSDSEMYELIGYMNIRTGNCRIGCEYDQGEILYFNRRDK